jgi:hypothetical protein
MDDQQVQNLIDRITDYLAMGGLFNPELADHLTVRDLLIDCRSALNGRTNPRIYSKINRGN